MLEVDNGSICDSWVICEYLEETFPDQSPLLPKDPYQRSIARTWIDFINKSIVPAFFRLLQAQPEETEKRAKALVEFNTALGKLSEKHKGPFFFGDKISLVDIFIAPWAVRDFILRDYREFKRSMVQGWADWAQRLEDYPSVVKTTSVRNSSSYQVIATDCRTGTAVLY